MNCDASKEIIIIVSQIAVTWKVELSFFPRGLPNVRHFSIHVIQMLFSNADDGRQSHHENRGGKQDVANFFHKISFGGDTTPIGSVFKGRKDFVDESGVL